MIADTYLIDGINFISLPKDFYNIKFSLSSTDEGRNINNLINKISNFNISKINKNNINDFYIEFYFGTQTNNTVNFVKNNDFFPLVSSMTILEDCYDNDIENNTDGINNYCLNIFTNILAQLGLTEEVVVESGKFSWGNNASSFSFASIKARAV